MIEHPFVPGARVAINDRWGDGVTESLVEKVYKNGRFTLRGSKQQWRAWCNGYGESRIWRATETGDTWNPASLSIWDETTDKEIRDRIKARNISNRWRKIRSTIDNTKEPTAALCDAIETALAKGHPRHD